MTFDGKDVSGGPISCVVVSGSGAFDPATKKAAGGGTFIVKDNTGAVIAQGAWQVTGFVSWPQLPGDYTPGLKVNAPPPPACTIHSAGILTVKVKFENLGEGEMEVHARLPTTPNPDLEQLNGIVMNIKSMIEDTD